MVTALLSCRHVRVQLPTHDPLQIRPLVIPQLAHREDTNPRMLLSADGSVAVTQGWADGRPADLFVWDVVRGKQIRHEHGDFEAALSRDGHVLAMLRGSELRLCALTTGACSRVTIPGKATNSTSNRSLAFSSSERYVWACSENKAQVIRVADTMPILQYGTCIDALIDEPNGQLNGFYTEPTPGRADHSRLVHMHWQGNAPYVTLAGAELPFAGPDAVAVSADGTRMVLARNDDAVLIDSAHPERAIPLKAKAVSDVDFVGNSPVTYSSWLRERKTYDDAGRLLTTEDVTLRAMRGRATASVDHTIHIGDITHRLDLVTAIPAVRSSASPNGRRLIVQIDTHGWLWDLEDPRGAVELADVDTKASMFVTNEILAIAAERTQLWNAVADTRVVLEGVASGRVLAHSTDGRLVFRSSEDSGVVGEVWHLPEVRPMVLRIAGWPPGEHEEVVDAAFSADGRLLVTGASTGVARVWDLASGAQLARLDHPNPVARVSVASGTVLTAHGKDSYLTPRVWELPASGKPLPRVLAVPGTQLHAVGADGSHALVDSWIIGSDGARIWRVPAAIRGPGALTDDGARAAVVDGPTLRVYTRGEFVDTIDLGEARLVSIAFQGPTLLRGVDEDGVIYLWRSCDRDRACRGQNPTELCRIIATDGGWVAVDPVGRYDTSNFDVLSRVAWVLSDRRMEAMPGDLFIRDYYVPGLVSTLTSPILTSSPARSLPPAADLARVDRAIPEVEIESFVVDPATPSRAHVTLTVNSESNSDAFDLRVLRDGNLVAEQPASDRLAGDDLDHWRAKTRLDRRIELDIPLDATRGTTEISAYAFNASRLKGPTVRKTYSYTPDRSAAKPRAFVVTIGVGSSGEGLETLRWAPDDALAMADLLGRSLDRMYAVTSIPLVSQSGARRARACADPTRSAVEQTLQWLAGTAVSPPCAITAATPVRPEDLLIIYVSAHGVDEHGEFAIVMEGGDRITSSMLARWMRTLQSDRIVVILDTCDSEQVVGSGFRAGPLGDFTFGQLAYDKTMQILTAAGVNQDAVDSPTLGGSLLVDSFREVLRGGRPVTTSALLRAAVHGVPRKFRELQLAGQLQKPVVFDYRKRSDVVLEYR